MKIFNAGKKEDKNMRPLTFCPLLPSTTSTFLSYEILRDIRTMEITMAGLLLRSEID